jgi:hypothetical protein
MRRAIIIILLSAGSSVAQDKADFSGIFLRTETIDEKHASKPAVPRILEIVQTPDDIQVKAIQNQETAVADYPLHSKKPDEVKVRLSHNSLKLKLSDALIERGSVFVLEQQWELSPDGKSLSIGDTGLWSTNIENYVREPSLEAAQSTANALPKKKCEHDPWDLPSDSEKQKTWRYDEGAQLGYASFPQITQCVMYDAVLSGDPLKHLVRLSKPSGSEFLQQNEPVTTYSGDVVLEVQAHNRRCQEFGTWASIGPRELEAEKNLRFMVRWLGSEQKDYGEVQAEFRHQPWREDKAPEDFYRMTISARGIPLADELEVTIFSGDGRELACIEGRL